MAENLILILFVMLMVALFVATVDHGLRPESATEADWVAQQAKSLGVPHETLIWNNWDGRGNLQDRARQERYGLLADWARRNDLGAIALGVILVWLNLGSI